MLPASERKSYSIPEAAGVVGLSRTTVWRWVRTGRLPSFRWGGRRLIRADDLQAAIDAVSGRAPEPDDARRNRG